MSWRISNKMFAVAAFAALLFTAGCSGGSTSSTSSLNEGGGGAGANGGSGTALAIVERVSVVDASSSSAKPGQVKPLVAGFGALSSVDLVGTLPAGTDYFTDPQFTFVEERSTETFSTVNEILCMMAQTKYDEMVNQGDYIAQIDSGQCSGNNDDAQSAGQSSQNQSSGANATEYEFWTVNSYRTDNSSPHVLVFWVNQEEDFGDGGATKTVIQAKAEITASAIDAPPYGLFTMNFIAYLVEADGSLSSTWLFKGLLNSVDNNGQVLLQFGMKENAAFFNGQGGFAQLATLYRSADGTSGSGTVLLEESVGGGTSTEKTFNFAFDDVAFLRVDTASSTEVCLDRQNFDETIWRYNLYYDETHATDPGGRVDVNSGFSIEYVSSGVTYQGWIGFWGLWFENDVNIANGDTVTKVDWNDDGTTTGTDYTVFISDGKLRKHSRKTVPLDDIAGIPLQWGQPDSITNEWVEYKVEWNKTDAQFYKVATMDQQNYIWQDIATPLAVTFTNNDYSFDFWSNALGGSGRLNLGRDGAGDVVQPDGTSSVVFYMEDIVYPGDAGVPTTLACFENCPDPTTINGTSPYFTNTTLEANPNLNTQDGVAPASAVYRQYTYDPTNMTLKYSGSDADAVTTSVVMTDATNSSWGVWTGPMFDPSIDRTFLECDWDATSTCGWNIWNLDVYYTWETGVDQWNKFTGIKNPTTDAFLKFDPPLNVDYTHAWSATAGDTSKYFLEYGGNGDLWGIPGKCVNEQGVDTDCNDWTNEFIRWVPEFSIVDGSSVTDASDSTIKYYVKGMEKEQRMKEYTSTCPISSTDLTTYTLPDPQEVWVDPALGAEPDVTDSPAVIAGELQVTL